MITVEERQRHTAREPDPNNPLAVIAPSQTFETVSEQISSIVLTRKVPLFWWCTFGFGVFLLIVFVIAVTYLLGKGVGIWGIEIPNAWGFAITNFVWWIGIGHAGTLISAILLLLNQAWRNSINRFAEAMTLFAVACAGIFPLLHLGRSWIFYWILPYPNTMTIQPNFRSPLVWDVFAVSTYATISLLFWYLGMIPDLANAARPRADEVQKRVLRRARVRLARRFASLEMASERVSVAGRARNAAGAFCPYGGQLRFHHRDSARVAFHDFSAILCRGRDLLRIRDGACALHPTARSLWAP